MIDNTQYRKGTIKTYSGIYVDPLNMRVEDIRIVDAAHSLAYAARYNGHYPVRRSIARHSVEVALLLLEWHGDKQLALEGLCHDVEEAYTGDMVNPLKRQPEMEPFVHAGDELQKVVCQKYGLTFPFSGLIHEADQFNGELERYDWNHGIGLATITENPVQVEREFIELFVQLGGFDEHLEANR